VSALKIFLTCVDELGEKRAGGRYMNTCDEADRRKKGKPLQAVGRAQRGTGTAASSFWKLGVVLIAASLAQALAQDAPPVRPVLSIDRLDDRTVQLSWGNAQASYILQETDCLGDPGLWHGVLQPPVVQGSRWVVPQPVSLLTDGARFLRLVIKGAPAGFDYLVTWQKPDGSWGMLGGTLLCDTAGVLTSLTLAGQTDTASFATGLSALASFSPRNNDAPTFLRIPVVVIGVTHELRGVFRNLCKIPIQQEPI
jgi:hypothetical protein